MEMSSELLQWWSVAGGEDDSPRKSFLLAANEMERWLSALGRAQELEFSFKMQQLSLFMETHI